MQFSALPVVLLFVCVVTCPGNNLLSIQHLQPKQYSGNIITQQAGCNCRVSPCTAMISRGHHQAPGSFWITMPYQKEVYFKFILLSILKYSSSIFLRILYVSIQISVY